jgi:hypothetical protein
MSQQPHVTFENVTQTPQQTVHINAMFQQQPSTSNNHTNSAQGPTSLPGAGYVPNKYSAHYDPAMPDWEGVTIAERTMADISTLSPPPEDYYGPYAPPVVMVPNIAEATPWEELEETDAERADWKNPGYKEGSTISGGEPTALQPRDRKLIWGLIGLVTLLVVVVAIVVPLVFTKAGYINQQSAVVGEDTTGTVVSETVSPSMGPTAEPVAPCENPPCDFIPPLPTDINGVGNTTDDSILLQFETTEAATIEPSEGNGRGTDEPTPAPITPEPVLAIETPGPNPSPSTITESTLEPTVQQTPEPTPEPTSKPTESPVSSAPTPSPEQSLLVQNLNTRAKQWLEAHNTRRLDYHENVYQVPYVPLVWSDSLAQDAQSWAEELNTGDGCSAYTQDDESIGQTGYASWSTSNSDFDDPDDILTWWFDKESSLDYPDNKKFSQVLWRASKYLGCGESMEEIIEDGKTAYCRVYVCNYIRKGEF